MKKLLIIALLLTPLGAFAAVPAFPMSFYGTTTIDGAPAPVGTIIRGYYGTTRAGQVTLSDVGVYGYDNPMKQQLLLGAGTGTIRFTVQSSTINSGAETEGLVLQTHPSFVSGDVISKNFAFTLTAPVVTPPQPPAPVTPPPPATSGGGGGGGGGTAMIYGCMDKLATNYSSIANTDNKACLYPLGKGASDKMMVLPTPATTKKGEVLGVSTYIFTRNLSIGSMGTDVTELQKRLTTDGFYSGPITGYFGPLTGVGVKKFQSAHELEQVGNVGPKTRSILNQGGSVLGASTISTSATVLTPEARETLIKQLLAMILELQKQLAELKASSR